MPERQPSGANRLREQPEQPGVDGGLVRPQPGEVHDVADLVQIVVVQVPRFKGRLGPMDEAGVVVDPAHGPNLRMSGDRRIRWHTRHDTAATLAVGGVRVADMVPRHYIRVRSLETAAVRAAFPWTSSLA
jgi:hypothetical protein